ncbi:MAG TPA: phosphatidylserine decarboxylase [Streptomyces sp.]|uniref:phosphatidylserine decarboxylase n=1 Tax=Streptomyces sp. TaxID=1931 RepID=UPI002C5D30B3|nr:phosphatidylserine decarboxylase [Streptomyces sp.]HWU06732.1 phosphatidylserine decarboxylase [Streptomyces sp.]
MNGTDQIIHDLQVTIDSDDRGLGTLIEKSLRNAGELAEARLDTDLFEALDWPQSLPDYYAYLKRFIRWVPRQSDAAAWKKSAPEQRYAREVSDRLAHFFWLIDQKVGDGRTAVAENSDSFRDWLTAFARQWGSFLDTTESFSQEILDSFIRDAPEYNIEESLVNGRPNMPSGWLTFNQFFARELNPGLRPVCEPTNNMIVTSPADCEFQHCYGIDQSSNIPRTTIKETHHYGNIQQLIEGSQYADTFANGTFVHYMLPPSAYHRYHVPVSGLVKESYVISGKVYMQVDLENHKLVSKDSAQSGYEFSQARGVLTLDTSGSDHGDLGIVAVIAVGMGHVASVNLTTVPGTHVVKGEEFGYFQFGGSDIIVLFQDGVTPEVSDDEGFRLVGSVIARCSPSA